MKLTIGKKIIGSFVIVALIFATISGITMYFFNKVDATYADLVDRRAQILSNTDQMQFLADHQVSVIRGYLLGEGKDKLTKYEGDTKAMAKLIVDTIPMLSTDTDKQTLSKLKDSNDQLKIRYDKMMELDKTNKQDAIDYAIKEVTAFGVTNRDLAKSIADRQQKFLADGSIQNKSTVSSIQRTVVILSVFVSLAAILIGLYISRIISKPLQLLEAAAQSIASGDLTGEEIQVKSRDEIGSLAKSFSQMTSNLRTLIRQVGSSAEQVAASSEQLSASAEQTSRATEQIASTVQEVATDTEKQVESVKETVNTVNDMSAGVHQIATNAQTVSSSVVQTAEVATDGNQAIQSAVDQMNSINHTVNGLAEVIQELGKSSREIGQIVQVITDIASQTNLLALNAAIEAARAGEQGRGFAVVADEVRKLAEQSSASAQQIAELINAIQGETDKAVDSMANATKEVAGGIEVVNSAGKAFDQIRQSVNTVTEQIHEVSAASQQLSAGTEQVVKSVEQISEVAETTAGGTQTVSAAAEEQLASMQEITSSATALSNMAEELQNQIRRFKI